MRSDNSHHLLAAARQRSEKTRRRAEAAIAQITAAGASVTFDSVAREAGVSRSWLYAQQDLRADIDRLRQRTPARTTPAAPPATQHASDTSLIRRLEAATEHAASAIARKHGSGESAAKIQAQVIMART